MRYRLRKHSRNDPCDNSGLGGGNQSNITDLTSVVGGRSSSLRDGVAADAGEHSQLERHVDGTVHGSGA